MTKLFRMLKVVVCLGMLAAFVGCASTSTEKRETPGQYVDDTVITSQVKALFAKDPDVKAYQVGVETYQGVVQLSGFVGNEESIKKATEIARSVKGVKDVKNDLLIKK